MVTIDEVARYAGVSQSTVSYVLSGKRSISPETAARVREGIEVLGYRPHALARALAGNRSSIVGVAVPIRPDTQLRVMMEFVMETAARARFHDYDVLLLTEAEGPDALHRAADGGLVDGLIAMDVALDDPRVPLLRRLKRPAVLIGVPSDPTGLTCVDLDFAAAGELCVEHLADLGHRGVAFLGQSREIYSSGFGYALRTLDGVKAAAARRRLRLRSTPCEHQPGGVQAALGRLLSGRSQPTALVVHNEVLLPLVAQWVREHAVAVPDDLSVVAICPSDVAEGLWPGLTHVDLPTRELSDRAMDLLVARIAGSEPPEVTALAPGLTPGTTSAPPRPASRALLRT